MKDRFWRAIKKLHFGLVLGLFVTAYIGYYLILTVKHNYELQGQISGLRQQINNLQGERDELKYKIQYYQTDAYKEKEARAKLGLQAPGEGVVILPHTDKPTTTQPDKPKPVRKSNLQQWLDFLKGAS